MSAASELDGEALAEAVVRCRDEQDSHLWSFLATGASVTGSGRYACGPRHSWSVKRVTRKVMG